jgi:hypothetical protein
MVYKSDRLEMAQVRFTLKNEFQSSAGGIRSTFSCGLVGKKDGRFLAVKLVDQAEDVIQIQPV